jgi:hypothetical protein
MSRATIIDLSLFAVGAFFGVFGFVSAPNSRIPPVLITVYLAASAAVFGLLAVRGLRRKRRWQRFMGAAAALLALLMLGFAIYAYWVLGQIVFVY